MQRRWRWVYIALLGLVPFSLGLAQEAKDGAPGPWAREAIELVKRKGLFIGYPDGSFRWQQPATRQEVAMVLFRLIASYGLENFKPEEIQVLRQAVAELKAGLAENQEKDQALQARLEALEKGLGLLAQREEVEALAGQVQGIRGEVEALKAQVKALKEGAGTLKPQDLSGLSEGQKALEDKVRLLEERLQKAEREIAQNKEALGAIQEAVQEDRRLFQELSAQAQGQAEAATRTAEAARAQLQDLSGRVEGLARDLEALKARVAALEEAQRRTEEAQRQTQDRVNTLLPEKGRFYLGLGGYYQPARANGSDEVFLRGFLGMDRVLAGLGFRLDYDLGLKGSGSALGASLVYRMDLGTTEAYLGVGGGYRLDPSFSFQSPFGELRLGMGQDLLGGAGLFLEGAYRRFLSGAGQSGFSVASGVKLRF